MKINKNLLDNASFLRRKFSIVVFESWKLKVLKVSTFNTYCWNPPGPNLRPETNHRHLTASYPSVPYLIIMPTYHRTIPAPNYYRGRCPPDSGGTFHHVRYACLSSRTLWPASTYLWIPRHPPIIPQKRDWTPLTRDQWCTITQAGRRTLRLDRRWTSDHHTVDPAMIPAGSDDAHCPGSNIRPTTDTVWLIIIVPTDWDGLRCKNRSFQNGTVFHL